MAQEIVELTASLYDFMRSSEPLLPTSTKKRARDATAPLLDRAHQLSQRFADARARAGERASHAVEDASRNLRALASELASRRPSQQQIQALWSALGQNYEALFAQVRERHLPVPRGVHLGHVKPRNLARNAFHAACGVGAVLLYEFVLPLTGMLVLGGSLLAGFIALDLARRFRPDLNDSLIQRTFQKIARPVEAYRVPSATWMLSAMLIGVVLLPRYAIELGTLVLALGDPVASLAGKRWGRIRLVGDKSLAGSTAFFLMSFTVVLLWSWAVVPVSGTGQLIGLSAGVALAGALAELLSGPVDDNFTIPLVAGFAAFLLL